MTGRISKVGDHGVRVALYEAANVMLSRPVSRRRWRQYLSALYYGSLKIKQKSTQNAARARVS
ncbi:hypothetical protein [Mesorhizobium sp. M0771]|uniref:hypothetical protein n=1 Tax=Mesorhizobium sp. M0771 TaxID=2956997 RepID=UPI003338680A